MTNRIEIDGKLTRIRIRVDGHLMTASAARLLLSWNALPVLQLDLPLDEDMVVALGAGHVIPGDSTRAALIAMGWTPPHASRGQGM